MCIFAFDLIVFLLSWNKLWYLGYSIAVFMILTNLVILNTYTSMYVCPWQKSCMGGRGLQYTVVFDFDFSIRLLYIEMSCYWRFPPPATPKGLDRIDHLPCIIRFNKMDNASDLNPFGAKYSYLYVGPSAE